MVVLITHLPRPLRRIISSILACAALFVMPNAYAAEIWFAPGDDLDVHGVVAHPDFQELFSPGSPWQLGINRIDVLQVRSPWFLRMPEAAVKQVTSFSIEHRIGLAVPLDSVGSDTCGKNIEGLTSIRGLTVYPRELRRKDVPLKYVVLDEPIYYGHQFIAPNSCNFSIQEVAKRVADGIHVFRSYYPNIKVVLSEPEQSLSGGVADLASFLDSYHQSLGEYPAAFRLDIQWQKDWLGGIPPLVQMLRARHVGLSVIFNARQGGLAPDDGAWVRSAEENTESFYRNTRLNPEQAVIQTWDKRPERILPQSDPATMTGFLKWFLTFTRQVNR